MRPTAHRPFSRDQRTTIVYSMLAFVLIIVILQLWLLTATMNAWLGSDDSVVLPAAAASLGCLGLNVGLLWYLGRLERPVFALRASARQAESLDHTVTGNPDR